MRRLEDYSDYVGLTEQEARQKAKKDGIKLRVIDRDGYPAFIKQDADPHRLNVSVHLGKVSAVVRIG